MVSLIDAMTQEFWLAFAIWGGLIFSGLLVSISLLAIALNRNFFKRKGTIIKEIYDEKQRKNGQKKGGSQGSY